MRLITTSWNSAW